MRNDNESSFSAIFLTGLMSSIAVGIGLVAGIGIVTGTAALLLAWPFRRFALSAAVGQPDISPGPHRGRSAAGAPMA